MKKPIDVLPHRPPFLYIDEVLRCDATSVHAVRTFRPDEDFFRGHFPGRPIVPGVILVEALAQALAYLALSQQPGKVVYLAGIDKARFRKPVLPGERVELFVSFEASRLGVMRCSAEARVLGKKVADATLLGVIEDAPPS